MYKINTIFFEKILSSLLYILPIALVTSSFISDFCVSVASLIFIILIIYKKEFFYLKNKFFFFYNLEFLFNNNFFNIRQSISFVRK